MSKIDYSEQFREDMIAEFGGGKCPFDLKLALQRGESVYKWLAPYVVTRYHPKNELIQKIVEQESLSSADAERRIEKRYKLALAFCEEIMGPE